MTIFRNKIIILRIKNDKEMKTMEDTIFILNGIRKLSENQNEFMKKLDGICTKLENMDSRLEALEIKNDIAGTDMALLKKGHNDIMQSIVNAVEILGKEASMTKELVKANTYDIELIKTLVK